MIKKIKAKGKINDEGYVNVASELGLSGMRGTVLLYFVSYQKTY